MSPPKRYPAPSVDNSILGEPLKFRSGKIAKNRFMKAAMTERIASYHDNFELRGIPNQRLLNMYQKWAHGGFGIVLTGNIATHPTNLEFAGNMMISKENANDELKKWFTEMAKVIKAEGSLAIAQLTNAGRQTPEAIERHPFSASDVQLTKPEAGRRGKPVPLTIEQIKTEVIDRYTFAAEFLYQCGFDGVQIHGAHGYLFSQFLSPTTNKRTDQYGGPIENRARIFLETYQSIR